MGMIGMAPSEFWNASIVEVHAAIEGFMEFNTDGSTAPMRRDELEDLMERYPD